ncbi:MAG: cyclodeaminase/cyclohydrolase family protein, partial [Candidatus Omnitrophica bacterium]|nr:cyclodeaminase/cyclohydrolase family protein [Candidatus Omnitrophota bacterium]
KPAPGGGSAICLIFCMGTSLLEKAIRYSCPKEENLQAKRMRSVVKDLSLLRYKVLPYVDLDGKVFKALMAAGPAARKKLIKKSEQIVVNTGCNCQKAFLLAKEVESGIKKNIVSDFYIGVECLQLALRGCLHNLEANDAIFGKPSRFVKIFKTYLGRR